MAIRVALNHKTSYRYARPVWLSPQVLRLRPAPHCRTPVLSYSLSIKPEGHFINWQQDPYGNRLARLVFPKQTRSFSVEVDLIAELTVINPFDFFVDKDAENYPFKYDAVLSRELIPYLEADSAGLKLLEYVARVRKENVRTVDYLVELNHRLSKEIKYLIRLEPGIQKPEETLSLLSGSCRDSSWLLVQILRHLGLAARFVSGYLIQLVPDVKSLDGPSGAERDFTDLHAWAEVYLPGAGWVGLDPTSGLLAGEGHIPLACSADPVTAAAITGYCSIDDREVVTADPEDGASHGNGDGAPKDDFTFAMSVTRIHEDPRVTKPYTDEQWAQIESLGHQVDADLNRGDVRLTMGGEPTFVSIDDMDGPEWTSAALGPLKYRRGDELVRRLRDKFAPEGFLHHGQGKWYPGESLPRWSLGLYWRKDGQPIWRDKSLIADENKPRRHTENDARAFAVRLAERLGVEPRFLVPGFEDAWYHLWKERRLPVNVDPFDSKLENREERTRLASIFEQGLDKSVGYALPLKRERYIDGTGEWVSGDWFFRPERMYLIPGDSPMGYRLPLDSLPWVVKSDFPFLHELDPWADRGPLPPREQIARQRYLAGALEPRTPRGYAEQTLGPEAAPGPRPGAIAGDRDAARRRSLMPDLPPAHGVSAPWLIRTALTTQARGGVLRVFTPPVRYLEDYLELITAIEDTAADLEIPVLIEGYTPPYDPRLCQIKVTPDPGVIEVNTHPVESWDDLVRNTTLLYEEARQTRLGTEKFMIDGRHTGTGGGNHIVVGGPTPADSPLLRRPDLLRSLLGYWHNHPSLSYLFSGMFVGPTSPAPRIDEARNDQVAELEIAFKQVPDHGDCPPWLVDRIFRNILIDVTGNTHRAEFCIDKLYAPESPTGRLGLLEMRAFEMPPHARMSLTQHLLLRALIAQFWKKPYTNRLVRWRTEIHDRFMLPHFVKQDLEDVIFESNQAGYPLKAEWFAPHLEFRFPHYGSIQQRGLDLELRQAIEPWHVLGEEPAGGATVRYVDSSVERLQVLVNGMVDTRHVIACNGVRVPLHPTGTNGRFVAGVRYRAWQPPECLHPTIKVHSPLVFDVIDTWAGRSIGGCTYHVSHPGGRNYETFPVNAYEAEGRRIARFYSIGHTPGPSKITEPPENKEAPFTLDLRRA
ncbi:MAG: transglutaminase domain protein [Phycisphaerales bacterium]|nr:transglutaminase domain protein [Phycisphaerales bacterium]